MRVALAIILLTFPAAAEPRRLLCDYTQYASPRGLKAEKFRLEFIVDGERAVMIGNNGISDVEMHAGDHGFTFLEKVPAGVVQTTTVARDGSSVHSRHTIIGKLVPSRYYGKCDFVRGFASGGRPTPGEVVLVGEHGPELFVADQPGTVLPGFGSLAPAAPWHWWDGIPGTPAAPTVAAPPPYVMPVPGTPSMPGYVAPGSLNFSPGRDRIGTTQ